MGIVDLGWGELGEFGGVKEEIEWEGGNLTMRGNGRIGVGGVSDLSESSGN